MVNKLHLSVFRYHTCLKFSGFQIDVHSFKVLQVKQPDKEFIFKSAQNSLHFVLNTSQVFAMLTYVRFLTFLALHCVIDSSSIA